VTRPRLTAEPLPGLVDTGSAWLGGFGGPAARPPRQTADPITGALRIKGAWRSVVHPSGASSATVTAADLLATQLGRWASPAPTRSADTGGPVVVVGLSAELGGWAGPGKLGWRFQGARTLVYGTSAATLTAAIWQLLAELGYAALSPSADWEILPTVGPLVRLQAEASRSPPAAITGIGSGGGVVTSQLAPLADWRVRAGIVVDGLGYRFGHRWAQIVSNHPGTLVPGNGLVSSTGTKLLTTSPVVQAAMIADALPEDDGTAAVLSMEAADGTKGWNEVGPLSPADLLITGANAVAAAVTCGVGILGYSSTTDPFPTVRAHPRLWCLINDSPSFILGNHTVEQVRDAYAAVGVQHLGVYSQTSLWDINYALPGLGQLVDPTKVVQLWGRLAWSASATMDVADSWVHSLRGLYAVLGPDPMARWAALPGLAFPSAPTQAAAAFDVQGVQNADPAAAVLALLNAVPSGTAEARRALDLGRWAVYVRLVRVYRATPTPDTLEPVLIWLWRCFMDGRWIAAYRFPYFDPNWGADCDVLAARYGLANLNTTNQPWTYVPVTEAEVRSLLA
jgi:hypothetical protein